MMTIGQRRRNVKRLGLGAVTFLLAVSLLGVVTARSPNRRPRRRPGPEGLRQRRPPRGGPLLSPEPEPDSVNSDICRAIEEIRRTTNSMGPS